MGAGQSTAANVPLAENSLSAQLSNRHGFQILKTHPNSPVSEARVQSYFDYIIAVNGVNVSQDLPNIIGEMARNHVNKPLRLTLYNSREDEQRTVTIVPRSGWGGEGLLGCAIRFCPLDGVRDRVWHVLAVYPNSPAAQAGLKPIEDYIIGCPDVVIRTPDDFYELITQNTNRSINLVVFSVPTRAQEASHDEGSIREVSIVPDFSWGGEGCLGCDVGSGMLHWIPKRGRRMGEMLSVPGVDASAGGSASAGQNASLPAGVQMTQSSPTIASVVSPVGSVQPVQSAQTPGSFMPSVAGNPFSTRSSNPPAIQHPVPAETTASFMDDIPMPNFTVPSDIFQTPSTEATSHRSTGVVGASGNGRSEAVIASQDDFIQNDLT